MVAKQLALLWGQAGEERALGGNTQTENDQDTKIVEPLSGSGVHSSVQN